MRLFGQHLNMRTRLHASSPEAVAVAADPCEPKETPRTRAEINRSNAQNSTGPRSSEGKINSSRNSFKHGLYSKQLVTGAEEAAELDALKADLRDQHQPVNDTEEILVNEMAEQFWRIRRARRYEAMLLDKNDTILTHLTAIQRMMTSAERGFHKALTALRQLQKDRGFVPQNRESSASGFVPQSSIDQQNHECQRAATGFVSQIPSYECISAENAGHEPPRSPE
jgi:hypothetical protein